MNQKVGTKLGLTIIIIVSITAAALIWKCVEYKNESSKDTITSYSSGQKSVQDIPSCPDDIKICFDGTAARRVAPSCELETCQNVEIVEDNSWKTWINNDDKYSISYPSGFHPEGGHNIMNYDISNPEFTRGNPNGIKIQIQKDSFRGEIGDITIDSSEDYIEYRKKYSSEFVDNAKKIEIGDFIKMSQYTKNGPGGAFITFVAFNNENGYSYNILIFEPGYSKNKKLIEEILSTFKALE